MSSIHAIIVTDTGVINGGLALVAVESALTLARLGTRVTFISGTDEVDPRLEACPGLNLVRLGRTDYLARPDRLTAMHEGIYDREVATRLQAILQPLAAEGPAVVHLHGWVKVLSPAAISAIEAAGLRWIFTAHDYFGACPNGGFFLYPKGIACPHRPLSTGCLLTPCDSRSALHKYWRTARSWGQKRILDQATHLRGIIYPSHFAQGVLAPHLPRVRGEVLEFRTGLEPRPLAPYDPQGPIVYAGRLSPEKGVRVLAEAGRLLGRAVTFIGDGREMAPLQRDFPEHVYMGWQKQSFVWEFLRTASCVVFPSVWFETAGMVALEAMALGCPVIVSDGIVTTDYVDDGVTGTHFRRGEAASLAAAITRTLPVGERLRQTAYDRYWADPQNPETHCAALLSLYADALAAS